MKNLRALGLIFCIVSGVLFVLTVLVRVSVGIHPAGQLIEGAGTVTSNVFLGGAVLTLMIGGGCYLASMIRRSRRRGRSRRNPGNALLAGPRSLSADSEEATRPEPTSASEAYVPLTIAIVALLLVVAQQTRSLWEQRAALLAQRDLQAAPLRSAQEIQARLQTLGAGTARMAAQGNAAARAVLEDLRAQGVTFEAK